jgi:hypothetical protein
MKKQEMQVSFKCSKCFPEIKTEKEYKTNLMQSKIIFGRIKLNENIYCESCKTLIGSLYIK